mmetsp:Transcript_22227/g.33940  ORF Transcript_22227/g.33940 Transcript_22227/m.33940 type:complete len:126 (+) Transcript_22227:238-615(+)
MGCDGESALRTIFDQPLGSYGMQSQGDIIRAAKTACAQIPITWKPQHVKGRQDDSGFLPHSNGFLKRLFRLDDSQFRESTNRQFSSSSHQFQHKPISLWCSQGKVINHLPTWIKQQFFSPPALQW